jgi:hypothetical protein
MEENIGKSIQNIGIGYDFLKRFQVAQEMIARIDK